MATNEQQDKYDFLALAVLLIFISFLLLVLNDAMNFHNISNKKTTSSWFDSSWFRQPYTNARVLLSDYRDYETMNYIQTEKWVIREASIGTTVFWTTLERKS